MKLSLIYFSFVLGTLVKQAATDDSAYKSLKFGATTNDYVSLRPNMGSCVNSFSVCSWIRKMRSGNECTWFSYAVSSNHNEIWLGDNGGRNSVFGQYYNSLQSAAGVRTNEWYHYCLTWDSSTRNIIIYYNGVAKASGSRQSSSGRKLITGGTVILGQDQDKVGGSFASSQLFGGELQKLNMFTKKLSASEVMRLYNAGRCSDTVEKTFSRNLKWEDIIRASKHGNVQTLDTCSVVKLKKLEKELAEAEAELKKTQGSLIAGRTSNGKLSAQLDSTMKLLKKSEAEVKKLEGELAKTNDVLNKEMALRSQTQTKLTKTETQLKDTSTRLKNTEVLLYTSSFYNKVLTDELLGTLDTDWDKLGKYTVHATR